MMNTQGSREERLFTELFTAWYDHVLAYARRRVGDDIAQEVVADVFLAAWRNLDVLPAQPLPWLYHAAHFAIANQRRRLARQARLDYRARLEAGGITSADHSERVVADIELATAFQALSEADREVLRLAAWEGLGTAEIGEVVGCSAVAAKARLYRARQRLSKQLGKGPHQQESHSYARGTTIEETGI